MREWTTAEANAALSDLTGRVERVRALVRAGRDAAGRSSGNGQRRGDTFGRADAPASEAELRDLLARLHEDGIVLRDPERGLVDFHAVSPSGRDYWLCWVVGEPEVAWWHWPEDGFAGRTPLSQPPA